MSDDLDNLQRMLLVRHITIEEATNLANRIFDDVTIETESKFHNQFFYEICPILSIVNFLRGEFTHIKFMDKRASFDGLLCVRGGTEQKIEMTAAIDGYNDALQMELLAERGHAPAFQKIEATGRKGKRRFGKNTLGAFRPVDYDYGVLSPLLKSAISKKLSKAKTNPDYLGAWLGIVFDDHVQPTYEKKRSRFDPVCKELLHSCGRNVAPFSSVFFVGVSREYVFDSNSA